MKELRKNQQAILRKLDQRELVVESAPGTGKSMMAAVWLHALRERGLANRACWIVPRLTLKEQAVDDFGDPELIRLMGYPVKADGRPMYELNAPPGNRLVRPWAEFFGYVTTYDAVDMSPLVHEQAMTADGGRTALVIDECQHLVQGTPRAKYVKSMADRAVCVLRMSGKLIRNNQRERIADIPYETELDGSGRETSFARPRVDIAYGRLDAIKDRVLLPLDFVHYDAEVEFRRRSGEVVQLDRLKDASASDEGKAIYTALRTEFARKMTTDCVAEWKKYRSSGALNTRGEWFPANQHGKLLVVCATIEQANEVVGWLRNDFGLWQAAIATSDDNAEAKDAIRAFRTQLDANIIVTVGMAYEGMNAPEISHILCLTHIRAYSWLHQMLSRATRPSRVVCLDKYCVAFVMDDTSMNEVVTQYEQDQGDALNTLEMISGGGDGRCEWLFDPIIPIDSDVSGVRGHFAPAGQSAHPLVVEQDAVADAMKGLGVPDDRIQAMLRAGYPANASAPRPAPYNGPDRRIADRRREYGRLCDQVVKFLDLKTPEGKWDWKRPRADIKGHMIRRYGSGFDINRASEVQLDEMIELARRQLRDKSAE